MIASGKWRKLGLVYTPSGRHPKLRTHAANPLPIHIEGNIFRIFFSGRDADNRSSVGAVDIDIEKRAIVMEHDAPFMIHGPAGSFFEAGISIGNCYKVAGQLYMLFMGWQNPPGGHWRGDIGRLRVSPTLSLALDASQPLLGSDASDPISLSYPWVETLHAGRFRMWYGSTVSWDAGNGEMLHVIKSATSDDGHSWIRSGSSVPYQVGVAQAFSRPTIIRDEVGSHMWFSYRGRLGEGYRIGYAVSRNGTDWDLELSRTGIDISSTGWDSEMIEYPFAFSHGGRRYLLYNGNGYGKTGFGLAIYE